ncbi:MAG TPA: hypothetical protein VFW06_02195 [Acidimicrobiia bacterium]|nr:hypothetical protein [Acidimicrobiia bacterium]
MRRLMFARVPEPVKFVVIWAALVVALVAMEIGSLVFISLFD